MFGKDREVEIVLIHRTAGEASYTVYEFSTWQQAVCRGDELKALRYAEIKGKRGHLLWIPLMEPVEVPCDAAQRIPPLEGERCRPRRTLYFLLLEYLVLGAVCTLTTTSFTSIRNVRSILALIHEACGKIKWLSPKLTVEPVTAYPKAIGREKTVGFVWTLWYWGLVERGWWTRKLFVRLRREAFEKLGLGVKAHKKIQPQRDPRVVLPLQRKRVSSTSFRMVTAVPNNFRRRKNGRCFIRTAA